MTSLSIARCRLKVPLLLIACFRNLCVFVQKPKNYIEWYSNKLTTSTKQTVAASLSCSNRCFANQADRGTYVLLLQREPREPADVSHVTALYRDQAAVVACGSMWSIDSILVAQLSAWYSSYWNRSCKLDLVFFCLNLLLKYVLQFPDHTTAAYV